MKSVSPVKSAESSESRNEIESREWPGVAIARKFPAVVQFDFPRKRMGRMTRDRGGEKTPHLAETLRVILMTVGQQDVSRRDCSGRLDGAADDIAIPGRIDQCRVAVLRDDEIGEVVVVTTDRKLFHPKRHRQNSPSASASAA